MHRLWALSVLPLCAAHGMHSCASGALPHRYPAGRWWTTVYTLLSYPTATTRQCHASRPLRSQLWRDLDNFIASGVVVQFSARAFTSRRLSSLSSRVRNGASIVAGRHDCTIFSHACGSEALQRPRHRHLRRLRVIGGARQPPPGIDEPARRLPGQRRWLAHALRTVLTTLCHQPSPSTGVIS